MAKKSNPHGGSRAGAGRKPVNPEGKTKMIAGTVPEKLVRKLDAYAKRQGWNRSQAITNAIRLLLDSTKNEK